MDVILCGASGRMGKEMMGEIARSAHARVVAAVDRVLPNADCACYTRLSDVKEPADVVVDFSHRSGTVELIDFALSRELPLVIATTGQSEGEREYIRRASESIPIFFCGNMSLGVTLFVATVARVAATFPYAEVEIVETHHRGKADVPSGTALMIANAVLDARRGEGRIIVGRREGSRAKGDIGISSLRIGDVVGVHEVRIDTGFQTITLTHEAHSRALFTKGTMHAMSFICSQQPGLYSVKDFL